MEALVVADVLVRRLGFACGRNAEAVGAAHGRRAGQRGGELVRLAALQLGRWGGVPTVQRGLQPLNISTEQHIWVSKVSTFHCETPWKKNSAFTPSYGLDKCIQ